MSNAVSIGKLCDVLGHACNRLFCVPYMSVFGWR